MKLIIKVNAKRLNEIQQNISNDEFEFLLWAGCLGFDNYIISEDKVLTGDEYEYLEVICDENIAYMIKVFISLYTKGIVTFDYIIA